MEGICVPPQQRIVCLWALFLSVLNVLELPRFVHVFSYVLPLKEKDGRRPHFHADSGEGCSCSWVFRALSGDGVEPRLRLVFHAGRSSSDRSQLTGGWTQVLFAG